MNILDRSEGLGYVTTSYIIDGKGGFKIKKPKA
jgi:hypothetical protein